MSDVNTNEPDRTDRPGSYEQLYRTVAPSVVSIYTTAGESSRRGRSPRGAGSGFVYDDAGHVVTNQHVVGTADEVELRFSEGDWRTGTVVGADAYTDLAAVRIDDLPEDAAPLPMMEGTPTPGQPVVALGNPMGLDGTISTGIISGISRSMRTGRGFAIPDTVQTDAPINPGNSGGPLVTLDGEVIGVNRARSGDNIGFAVSPAIVERVVPELIETGLFQHPYLQIQTIDVSPTVAEVNGLDDARGVLVADVRLGPASAALKPSDRARKVRGREVPVGGDVIVGIEGTEINSHEELVRYLLVETEPGETVDLTIVRDGREMTEHITLGKRPQPETQTRVRRARPR
jgi:serine protease Do